MLPRRAIIGSALCAPTILRKAWATCSCSIIGPTASSSFITADFTSPQNYPNGGIGQQIVSQRMWGVSTGGAANNGFAEMANTTYQSNAATVNPGLWRINGDQAGSNTWWDSNQNVQTAAFANLINNFPKLDPLGISSIVIGANIPPQQTIPGVTNSTQYGTAMGRLATYLSTATMPNGKLLPIIGFEGPNEPDGLGNTSTWTPYYDAMASAVRAVNPNLLIFGPSVSFAGAEETTFSGTTSRRIDVYDWHTYNGAGSTTPWNSTRYTTDIRDRVNTYLHTESQALLLGEYNMDSSGNDANMETYIGAIYDAATIVQCINQAKVSFWAGIWDAWGDNHFGIISDPPGTIYPGGYTLAQGVRNVYGQRWQVPTNAPGFLTCAVTPGAGRFGLMLVNASNGTQNGQTVALSHWPVNTTGNGLANVWQMKSGQTGDGVASTVAVTAGVTAAMNFPDPSVTIISV